VVTFMPGQTVKNVPVKIKGDRVREPNETFFVLLNSPVNATIRIVVRRDLSSRGERRTGEGSGGRGSWTTPPTATGSATRSHQTRNPPNPCHPNPTYPRRSPTTTTPTTTFLSRCRRHGTAGRSPCTSLGI